MLQQSRQAFAREKSALSGCKALCWGCGQPVEVQASLKQQAQARMVDASAPVEDTDAPVPQDTKLVLAQKVRSQEQYRGPVLRL